MEAFAGSSKLKRENLRFDVGDNPAIRLVENDLNDLLSESDGTIREMCCYILNSGGKRIRPLLVIYSGLVFSVITEELIHAASAAELIHMASLVHDDIIDDSDMRRSRLSVNKRWGSHFAVLCGDYLFSRAFSTLARYRLVSSLSYMVNAIDGMCQGEVIQAENRFNITTDLKTYYNQITKKTANFLGCCCKSGASIGGAGKAELNAIGEYGTNLGIAFQIIDDVLDICGDPEVMGKPCAEDLRQGNFTLPVILSLELETSKDRVREMLSDDGWPKQKVMGICSLVKESGVIEEALDIADTYIEKAKSYLTYLPHSQYVEFLHSLACTLQARVN